MDGLASTSVRAGCRLRIMSEYSALILRMSTLEGAAFLRRVVVLAL